MTDRRVLVGLGLAGLVGAGLLAPSRVRARTEQPAYDLVARLAGGCVVRRYGPLVAACVPVPAGEDGRAFRRLAAFIFGANRDGAGEPVPIAMTAPVEVAPGGSGRTMRFFLPAGLDRARVPTPEDGGIVIEELPARTLAVARFAGGGQSEGAARAGERLDDALAGSAWVAEGEPALFFYDAPWVPGALRRNELVRAVTLRS